MIKTIVLRVISKRICYDHFLENKEPNTERVTLVVKSPEHRNKNFRIDYMFHWRYWIASKEKTRGYEDYSRFSKTNERDILRLTYDDLSENLDFNEKRVIRSFFVRTGDYYWPKNQDLTIFRQSGLEKRKRQMFLEKNCHDPVPELFFPINKIENLTQKWQIDAFEVRWWTYDREIHNLDRLAFEAEQNAREGNVPENPFIGRLLIKISKSEDGKIFWIGPILDYSDVKIEITDKEAQILIEDFTSQIEVGGVLKEKFQGTLRREGPLVALKQIEHHCFAGLSVACYTFWSAILVKELFEKIIKNDPSLLFSREISSLKEHPLIKNKLK